MKKKTTKRQTAQKTARAPKTQPTEEPQSQDAPPSVPTPEDKIAIADLRVSQDFVEHQGAEKLLLTLPVRAPYKTWWCRVHPSPEYQLLTTVLEIKEDFTKETFVIAPHLRDALTGEVTVSLRHLFLAINRQKTLFIWPVRTPADDGRRDEWQRTDTEAVLLAQSKWVRRTASKELSAYEVSVAKADWGEPVWPDRSFEELIRVAFKDHYLTRLDHPVLLTLRGEG